jgi:hypothetical protein
VLGVGERVVQVPQDVPYKVYVALNARDGGRGELRGSDDATWREH